MSAAAALVLRDRTNADPHQVLALALDELVAAGVWTTGRTWRGLRRVATLAPHADAPPSDLPEPLRCTDALLRRADADLDDDAPLVVGDVARWVAAHELRAADAAVRATVEDLVADGLLRRAPVGEAWIDGTLVATTALSITPAGEALLAADPPPRAVRPTAHDERRRARDLRALSPLGRTFVTAWLAAPTGVGGFAFGSVGAGTDGGDFENPTGPGSTGWGGGAGTGGGCALGGGAC